MDNRGQCRRRQARPRLLDIDLIKLVENGFKPLCWPIRWVQESFRPCV